MEVGGLPGAEEEGDLADGGAFGEGLGEVGGVATESGGFGEAAEGAEEDVHGLGFGADAAVLAVAG